MNWTTAKTRRASSTLARARSMGQARPALETLEKRTLLSVIPVGAEFRVNAHTLDFQVDPAIAIDPNGDMIVVWDSYGQDGDGRGIFGRRFTGAGVPLSGDFQINVFTPGHQINPAIAADAQGNFVVVWQSDGEDGAEWGIFGRLFEADGTPKGGAFQVNTFTTSSQRNPAVAMDADGDFVVVWDSPNFQPGWVYAQRFNAAAVPQGGEFRVNPASSGFAPAIASGTDGSFVIAWSGPGPGDTNGVVARRYDANGAALGDVFQVNTFTTNWQYHPAIASDPAGNFVIAWESLEQDGSGTGVYAQRFDSDGGKLGDEFRVNTLTVDHQNNISIAVDDNGDFVVTWTGSEPGASGYGVYAQRYSAAGSPQGGEFLVNTYTPNVQRHPSVAYDPSGNFAVAWESFGQDGSGFGVYAQRFATAVEVDLSRFHYATAPHRLMFSFNTDVLASLGTDDLVVQNLTTGQTIPASDFVLTYDSSTNTATFTYTGPGGGPAGTLQDGVYRATLLAAGITSPGGLSLRQDHVFDFHFLRGDANGDGRVNLQDFNRVAANFGQSPRDFTQGDFNYDGVVNLSDFNILASRFGQILIGAPKPGTAPSFGGGRTDDRQDETEELLR